MGKSTFNCLVGSIKELVERYCTIGSVHLDIIHLCLIGCIAIEQSQTSIYR